VKLHFSESHCAGSFLGHAFSQKKYLRPVVSDIPAVLHDQLDGIAAACFSKAPEARRN